MQKYLKYTYKLFFRKMVAHRGRGHPRGRGMRGGMFRGRGAFRGRGGGRGNFNGQNRNSVFIPFQPFDLELCQSHFPKVANTPTTVSSDQFLYFESDKCIKAFEI